METTYPNTNELNPQDIFQTMKSDFYKIPPIENRLISRDYIKKRKDLINFNHKLIKKMGFKSQTFFLSIHYLDIIFLQNKNLFIQNYFLLSLSCLIIAAKYCENDPNVPPLQSFITLYNRYNMHQISMKELLKMEVKILKYLNYNLYYLTIYDFNLFFFNHGIIKKQQIKDIINNNGISISNSNRMKSNKSDLSTNEELDFVFDENFYIKKILEKIYKRSRYYLDLIISKENICLKYDALLISVCIMKKSVEEVILKEHKIKFKDFILNKRQIIKKNDIYFKEIMYNFYKIDFESNNKYNEIIKENDIINIFQRQEKENVKYKKNKIQENFYNFNKLSNNNLNNRYKEKNSYNTINMASTSTNIINNNNQNEGVINLNNSMEKSNKEKNMIKSNLTLMKNYKQKNNNIKIEEENNETNSNSFIENIRKKYTFTQLKDNLKKDLSLRKKRCNDRYFHINNLKLLCQLTSCANIIKNIKEGSLSKGKISPETNNIKNKNSSNKLLIKEDNNKINTNTNKINSDLYYIKDESKEKIKKNYSKDKNINQNNNIINAFQNKNKSLYGSLEKKNKLNLENIDNNKSRYNKVIITDNFNSKEKYNPKFRKTVTESNNLESNRKPYFKKVIQNYDKKIINKNNIKINIYNILNTSNNINEINDIEKKRNFITLTNDIDYSQHKSNKIVLLKKRMNEINKMNKLKNLYNFKKIDWKLNPNLNSQNSLNINPEKRLNISPKANSKSKEINYINIINETNDNINDNKVSTLENQSNSYFKKKVFNSLNKNKKIFNNNKYIITQENIKSERDSGKFNKNKILVTNNINSNDININDIVKQKYNLQFHSKLFSTLTNSNK